MIYMQMARKMPKSVEKSSDDVMRDRVIEERVIGEIGSGGNLNLNLTIDILKI